MTPEAIARATLILQLRRTWNQICFSLQRLDKAGLRDSELFSELERAEQAIDRFEI